MTDDLEKLVTSHISSFLLRYYRSGVYLEEGGNKFDSERDRDLLKVHWTFSRAVTDLAQHILDHRHEIQSALANQERAEAGLVKGQIRARETLVHGLLNGNQSMIISREPVRSFGSGPNHVTAWVIQEAWQLSSRLLTNLPQDAAYYTLAEKSVDRLNRVKKISSIKSAFEQTNLARRPTAAGLLQAARSRHKTYRLAFKAYNTLLSVESGDLDTVHDVLTGTLVAPLELWRRFELAAAVSAAEALSQVSGHPAKLSILAGDNSKPIATVGPFSIYWQNRTPLYVEPELEPSEKIAREVLTRFGLRPDTDRPDLIITDSRKNQVVSIIEAKFFNVSAEDASDRLRSAAHQVVRYARGYRSISDMTSLIDKSSIVLARWGPTKKVYGAPSLLTLDDMTSGDAYYQWASCLI